MGKNYEYYYGNEGEQFSFLKIPKVFFQEEFEELSYGAKILYGLMLDRISLSKKNRWIDEDNRIYIYYTIQNIMEDFQICKTKAVKFSYELEKFGLIEKKKQPNAPTKIYVKNFIDAYENHSICKEVLNMDFQNPEVQNVEVQNMDFQKHSHKPSKHQEVHFMEVHEMDSNKTEKEDDRLYTSSSSSKVQEMEVKNWQDIIMRIIEIENCKAKNFMLPEDLKKSMIVILTQLFEVNIKQPDKYYINRQEIDRQEVLEKIAESINEKNFLYIAENIINCKDPIKQLPSYLISCFYNLAMGYTRLPAESKKNKFNDFQQNKYDMDELEKELISN